MAWEGKQASSDKGGLVSNSLINKKERTKWYCIRNKHYFELESWEGGLHCLAVSLVLCLFKSLNRWLVHVQLDRMKFTVCPAASGTWASLQITKCYHHVNTVVKIRGALSCFTGVVQCKGTCFIEEQNISLKTALWNWCQVQDFTVLLYRGWMTESSFHFCSLLQVPKPVDYSTQPWYAYKTSISVWMY